MKQTRPSNYMVMWHLLIQHGYQWIFIVGLLSAGYLSAAEPEIEGLGAAGEPNQVPASSVTTSPSQSTQTPSSLQGMVKLNFPNDVEIKVLVDYVSQRLNMKILYDEEIANKKVSLRVPSEVPTESLLGILQSALKMKSLALVDAEVPGWKRIVSGAKLPSMVPTGDIHNMASDTSTATAVTQIFMLKYADSQKVDQIIKSFLSQSGANSISIKEPNVLIITDFASNLMKVSKIVELMDQPRSEVVVELQPVHNVEATALAQQVNAVLAAKTKTQGDSSNASGGVEISPDVRTNQVVLVGSRTRVDEAISLIRAFDVPLGLQTETYACRYVSPERIDRMAKQMIDPVDAKRLYQSVVDAEGGMLLVSTTPEIHARIRSIKAKMDVSSAVNQKSNVKTYKLKNTTVDKVLETLRNIAGAEISDNDKRDTSNSGGAPAGNPDSIKLPLAPGQAPPASWPSADRSARNDQQKRSLGSFAGDDKNESGYPGGAKITADINTNSLIIWAEPSVQRMYEDLIKSLDHRRPQVLIEAKIVSVDTTGKFTLGVEVSSQASGASDFLGFSSFGLSTVSGTEGITSMTPAVGFNGVLMNSNTAALVFQALSSHSRAKVLASPRILVNDNTKGQLQSVLSVSYSSVNASTTVATTSVGGSQEAGTSINVTPHISEGDHLQLEFSIEFSSFTEESSDSSIPPPRHVDKIQSTVNMPDSYTVIVGGLNHHKDSQSLSGVPILEKIPVAKYLFSNKSLSDADTTLFIFLRPTILRDDKFKDLKFLSDGNADESQIQSQFPQSQPILMR